MIIKIEKLPVDDISNAIRAIPENDNTLEIDDGELWQRSDLETLIEHIAAILNEKKSITKLSLVPYLSTTNPKVVAEMLNMILEQCPQVTSLDLGGDRLLASDIQMLAEVMNKYPNITALSLSYSDLGNIDSPTLTEIKSNFEYITTIDLSNNALGKSDGKLLGLFPKATSFDLSYNELRLWGAGETAFQALAGLTKAKKLILRGNQLGHIRPQHTPPYPLTAVKVLFNYLAGWDTLDLTDNEWDCLTDSSNEFATVYENLAFLKDSCSIPVVENDRIKGREPGVKTLKLTGSDLVATDPAWITAFGKLFPGLAEVKLYNDSGFKLSGVGAMRLCEALKQPIEIQAASTGYSPTLYKPHAAKEEPTSQTSALSPS